MLEKYGATQLESSLEKKEGTTIKERDTVG